MFKPQSRKMVKQTHTMGLALKGLNLDTKFGDKH